MEETSKWAEIGTLNSTLQNIIKIVDSHRIHTKHINEQTIQLFTQLMESMESTIDQCIIYSRNVKLSKINLIVHNGCFGVPVVSEKTDSTTIRKAKRINKQKVIKELKETPKVMIEQKTGGQGSQASTMASTTTTTSSPTKEVESKRKSVQENGSPPVATVANTSASSTTSFTSTASSPLKKVPKETFKSKSKANKLVTNPTRYPNVMSRIKPLLLSYANFIKQTKLEINRMKKKNYTTILMELKNIYDGTYPNVQLYYFGSHITGLQGGDSDIDIFVDLDNCYESNPTREESLQRIQSADHLMYAKMHNFKIIKCISQARTPIINVRHRPSNLVCDLSFTNGLAHCNSKLISYLLNLQPLCYNVAIFIKLFVQRLKICMNTYTSLILVIFFFQQKGLLPSIYRLQCKIETPKLIGGWQSNFETLTLNELPIPLMKPTIHQTHQYLLGFFEYYGKIFQYENWVVCPLIGTPLKRSSFADVNSLPPEMKRYTEYINTENDKQYQLIVSTKMCVQDPFELIHNVAKAVPPQGLEIFKEICSHACELMKANVDELVTPGEIL